VWLVHLGLFAVIVSWAANQIVAKEIFASVSPMAFIFVRFCGLTLLAGLLLRRTRRAPWTRREVWLTLWAGLGGYFVNQLGFVLGLAHTTVFSTSLLISTSPLFTVLVLAVWRLEPVRPRQWVGLLVAFAGIAAFVSDGASLGFAAGDLLSLLGGVSFASFNIFNKPLLERHDPSEVMATNLLCGGAPLLAVSLPAALRQSWALPWGTWALVAYTVAIPVFLAYIVWNWGILRVGVARTAPYAYLTPVVAGILSAIVFGESFSAVKVVGAAACLLGLALAAARGGAPAGARPGQAPPEGAGS
jgi:drug/metabolite transporter (DMT)-like permease